MKKKTKRLILLIILLVLTVTNIAYVPSISAQMTSASSLPYGPKVEDLKGQKNLVGNLQSIQRIRANLTVIDINPDLTPTQLNDTYKILDGYSDQFNAIRSNLEKHKAQYKDSFADVFFSEQIMFIADSYLISIRVQQNLIKALEAKKEEAKKLFYSSYLIPVYYYLTLGDNMFSYIETYFVLS